MSPTSPSESLPRPAPPDRKRRTEEDSGGPSGTPPAPSVSSPSSTLDGSGQSPLRGSSVPGSSCHPTRPESPVSSDTGVGLGARTGA